MGKFVIKKTEAGFSFNLKATNNEIVATSEVYTTKAAALGGIESIRANCACEIEDQTVAGYEAKKHPKYELYTDKAGEFRFRLKASNGEIIANSEGYTAKTSALGGIESVRNNAPESPVVEE